MLMQVIAQLGIDSSILPQFIIVFTMFVLGKFLFFGRLQSVIDTRQENTTGLDSDNKTKIEEAEKLKADYLLAIQNKNKECLEKLNQEKTNIIKTNDTHYKEEETKINNYIEVQRKEVEQEIDSKRNDILIQANDLSDQLINKILS
jgi:F0F1-type ATP synthase membrane subunit b/b'